jgi:hypothetical protein
MSAFGQADITFGRVQRRSSNFMETYAAKLENWLKLGFDNDQQIISRVASLAATVIGDWTRVQ